MTCCFISFNLHNHFIDGKTQDYNLINVSQVQWYEVGEQEQTGALYLGMEGEMGNGTL
jgi:hypothetical protein